MYWATVTPDYAYNSLNNLAGAPEVEGGLQAAPGTYSSRPWRFASRRGRAPPRHADQPVQLGRPPLGTTGLRRGGSTPGQALAIDRSNLDLAAAAQSERQQLAMARDLRYRLDGVPLASAAWRTTPAGKPTAMCLPPRAPSFQRQRRLRILRRRSYGRILSPGPRSDSPTMSRRSSNWRLWPWPRPDPKQAEACRDQARRPGPAKG